MARTTRSLLALAVGMVSLLAAPAQGRGTVNDPVYEQGLQWGLARIGAPTAWSRASGAGITIAVIDSGVDLQHQDLRDKIVGQVSCVGADGSAGRCSGSAQDDNGHGTHVSGIALATTDNRLGVASVAPAARLLAVRVLVNDCDATGCTASGNSNDVSAGIRWAVDHGADVINLSLGGGAVQSTLGCSFCDAIDYAWSKGVISVIAAGNDSVLPSGFGDEPAVVVTATTRDDELASYSSSSSGIVRVARWPVAAPGGEAETRDTDCATGGSPQGILSTYWTAGKANQYACLAGTSMAAPHVSGALALLLSLGHSPQSAIDRLLATATDLGPKGRDDSFGYGRIDLAAAVGPASATTTAPTTAVPTTQRSGASATTAPARPGEVATSTTLAPPATAEAPPVSPPEVSAAAPFDPVPGDEDTVPGGLVALAALAVLASASGTAATAWRLLRR